MRPKAIRALSIFFVACGIFLHAPHAHADATLIAHWKFDETTAGSNAADSVGSNNGTPSNSPTPSTDVPPVSFDDPRSASFNGSNYFTFLNPVSTDFSICAWVKTTSTGGGTQHWTSAPIFDAESGGVGLDFGFGVGNGGKLMFGNGGTYMGSLQDRQVNGNTTINDGAWHNVCATRNNTTGDIKLYVDAVLDGSGTTGTGALTRNPNARTAYGYDGAALFVGNIDDLRIYDSVLTDTQLENLTGGSDNPDTPADDVPPVISGIATSTTPSRATITWTTDEDASSQVAYSVGSSYAFSTTEYDTDPRVTDHGITLKDLLSCTLYNFEAVSSDSAGNYATSTASSFLTTGCAGSATPTSIATSTVSVASAATTTASDSGRTLTVATPANFTATSSSVVIQVKGMPSGTVLDSIGKPSASLSSAASVVFDVTALIDNTTVLDSFDTPVTITYHYTDADIAGLQESSLKMYHYHDGAWLALDDCSVDTAANTITCDAPSFSTFAIFGTAPKSSSSSRPPGGSVQGQVKNLLAMGKTAEANALKTQWYWLFPASASVASGPANVRDLTVGAAGEDVRMLQQLLNANGSAIAASGPGSPGKETSYFGTLTRTALAAYQKKNGIAPSAGYFGPLTRAAIKAKGLSGVWW